jgi:hypothetical protein
MEHVYEFTNQRKLTKSEFLRWFQKKFLYTIRKFEMIKKGDILGYKKSTNFRDVVLDDLLKLYSTKAPVEVVKLPSKKAKKIVSSETASSESLEIIQELFKGKLKTKEHKPTIGKIIKPMYLFLDKEVLLYAKLKGLKHVKPKQDKDKISKLIKDLETKHPEIEHGIINGYLSLKN